MKKNYDITIIGSGLTGLSSSLALSSIGYKVALIDPKPLMFNGNQYPDNRTTAISSGSVSFYKKIGVWKSLDKYACPIKKILIEESSSKLNTSFSSEPDEEKIMGYMIENKNFLKTLIELTKTNKNIIKYDDKFLNFKRKQNSVLAYLKNNNSIESKLIIGADGRNSYLRKLANINYHLGGGVGCYRNYLEHLGPTQETRWKTLGDPFLTAEVKELLITGIEDQNIKLDDLISKRDKCLVEILKIKKENKF